MSEQDAAPSAPNSRLPSSLLACPTCRSPWREVATCPRCGADLVTLMHIAVKAWELRQAARAALYTDDQAANAVELSHTACQLHTTAPGQRLLALALVVNGHIAEAYALIEKLLEAS